MKPGTSIRLFPSSLRGRLVLLVLLAVLPALGLVIYNAIEQRRIGLKIAVEETLRLVRLAGKDHDLRIEGGRQLLVTLAQLRELRAQEAVATQTLFADLMQANPVYNNILAAYPDGQVFAAARPLPSDLTLAEQPYFVTVTNTRDFVVDAYRIEPGAEMATLSLAYPVFGRAQRLTAVVVVRLDLEWLYAQHAEAKLPEGSSFTVLDQDRVTLLRYPDPDRQFFGTRIPTSTRPTPPRPPEEASPLRPIREDSRVLPGRDGVRRLYGFGRLGERMGENAIALTIGVPVRIAHEKADQMLKRNLAFLGLVTVLALMAAWFGSEFFVLGKVRALLQMTRRLEEGDLQARVGPSEQRGELADLSRAFDRMAAALEKQFADRVRAEEALRTFNRQLEGHVEERTRELKRSNEDLEQFAYVASHDLQEPLRMVTSYLGLIAQRYRDKLDQDAKDFIGFAVDGAERMQHLIRDLLAYSRVQTRARPFEVLNLNEILAHVLDNLKVAVEESGATIEKGELPTVPGDASQLTQLLQNLVGNAIKFRGQEPPRIRIAAQDEGEVWHVTVQDNGIGISPRHFDRIFIIFQRLHGRDKYPGTGIGLAICKKIVDRHGGRIWVESSEGQGSIFHVTLSKNPPQPTPAA